VGDPASVTSSEISKRTRDRFDEQYPVGKLYPVEDLEDICEFAYTYLTDLWAEEVLLFLAQFAEHHGVTFRRSQVIRGPLSFLYGDSVYSCRIGPSMTDSRVICLNLSRASAVDVSRPLERDVQLDVSGRYRTIRLYVDESLHALPDALAEVSYECMTAGDRWIEAFVVAQLATIQEDPLAQLYALVRRPFSTEIGRTIRLYLVDPARGGGVFMDEEARLDTLARLAGYAYTSYEKAPIELLSGLLIARFAIEDTVARDIVPSMTTVVKSPMEIPSGTQVGLAQHIMYHGSGMVLQPLVAMEKLWIEAAYPANLRSHIEGVLDGERETLRQAVARMKFGKVAEAGELSRGRRSERARSEGLGEHLAGLAGRFTGGFMSEYIQ
jgi:hypothetical protein